MGPGPAARRPRRRSAVAIIGAVLLAPLVLLFSAAPASAHATLLFAAPAAEGGVAVAPTSLSLTFDGPVTLPASGALRLAGPSGGQIALGTPTLGGGRHTLNAAVRAKIGAGVYTVTWQVIASDGDDVTGTYRFAVGTDAAGLTGGSPAPSAPGAIPTAFARWLLVAALALLAGAAVMPSLLRRAAVAPWQLRRSWMLASSAVGMGAALLLLAVQAGDGSPLRGLPDLFGSTLTSGSGRILLVEATAFAASLIPAAFGRPRWLPLPGAVIVTAEALRAHPHEYTPGWGLLASLVHITAAALWLGALAHVIAFALTHRNQPKATRRLWRAYARIAAYLFAAAVASGVLAGLLLMPLHDVLSTGYGRLLLIKTAAVGLAAALAFTARTRLRAERPILPPARIEASVLAVVIALAAALTVLGPPRTVTTDLPFPPPASGPAVDLGARAGQIGIFAQVSDGQLVLHLSAPGDDGSGAGQGGGTGSAATGVVAQTSGSDTAYALTAVLTTPAGASSTLMSRGCGTGCFVAQVPWTAGDSILTLRASATGWVGGRTALAVPWPPRPVGTSLTTFAADLRATPSLSLFEQVSSDTATAPAPNRLQMAGTYFLGAEPYSSGQAPDADLVPGPGTDTTLLLGYPAEAIAVRLVLNQAGRPVSESLTDPDHLTTRTFEIPEG
jgi:copper transport protein